MTLPAVEKALEKQQQERNALRERSTAPARTDRSGGMGREHRDNGDGQVI